jgi:phosphoglycolate phosphatase-like HAD superfamily hydrolase
MLERLRAAGLRLAVISNAQAPYFEAALRWLELGPRFDHRECHGDLPPRSPAGKTALLRRALDALRVPAAVTCMVGDRGDDLAAGRELGCRTLAATWGFGTAVEWALADRQAHAPWDLVGLLGLDRAPGQPAAGG